MTPPERPATQDRQDENGERDVGAALRSIYRETIEEDVPDEMLDLLGKLD